MKTHPAPDTPRVNPHVWGRNTPNEIPGAVMYLGARDFFIPNDAIPAIINRLQAIHDLNA